ncbi:uncharacterized protein CEXT_815131 [Caerostris extrusa]|uniref:Uncharacterized protein n=1 Tax=Caerostris extrusa TaxID=172846 RepID=A0AAV4UEU1_CAEEX|nr:uncharacterized protein CEXT_815131 [Caerostris extrusa]
MLHLVERNPERKIRARHGSKRLRREQISCPTFAKGLQQPAESPSRLIFLPCTPRRTALARQIAKQFDPDIKVPDMMKNKYPDRMNPTPPARIPFTNLSNQTLSADTPDGSRTDSPLDRLSGRTMSMASPTQQERYMSPTPVIQTQFPGQQSAVTMNQTPYAKQNAVHQDSRYFPPQQQQQQPIDQRYGPQQPPSQLSYGSQSQGYGGYPPQPQYPAQKTSYLSAQQDPPVVPNRQGSFRRRPSARDPQGGYTMQQAMGDHFDHYRQEPPRIRTVIKHGRRIPSPPRSGMYPPAPRTSYGPDATPDSGVSESMDELSPSRFGRKSHLPPLIYGDSHASSLLSFAPSEEDRRSMSPTMSSAGAGQRAGLGSLNGQWSISSHCITVRDATPESDPREEVAYLSSQRREELRRMQYESERLRSNPLLYLVRPDLKDWFSRQQMILLVLFINISLAIMFYKLLS